MATTYLTRTQSTGNRTTFTFSAWVKRSSLGEQYLINAGPSGTSRTQFHFQGQDALQFYNNDGGSVNMYIKTNRLFRDLSAWYHIVLRFDTTQATASNRIRLYVNGEEETSLATNTIPSQNADNTQFNYNGIVADIGRRHYDNFGYFDGSMSHVHFCDGQSYDASAFGEYDANGVWKIKTSPSVTYGTNGFFILKDGNSVTDQSGNSNNFTVAGGTLTNTEDNPSNVFATLNPLDSGGGGSYSNGNLTYQSNTSDLKASASSFAINNGNAGKWYWEIKMVSKTGSVYQVGTISSTSSYNAQPYSQYSSGGQVYVNGSQVATVSTYTTNDIIGVAFDATTSEVKYYKNGSLVTTQTISNPNNILMFAGSHSDSSAGHSTYSFNFGNGYFGTTAVSSAGTNASGNGIFEYDVPTGGYTALSTKGLNL